MEDGWMTDLLIENGVVVTVDNRHRILKRGHVAIEDGRIIGVDKTAQALRKNKFEKKIDANGKIVMPGLICAHHHLYSTFARGLALPGEPATNFTEILERLWWKLDNALTKEDIHYSALITLLECTRQGTTTIMDHHESQSCQRGSLNEIARAVKKAGIRASLCLGTSDRYGRGRQGIEENERFLALLRSQPSHLLKGMVGLHAPFTVNNETLDKSVQLAKRYDVGIHCHCAEDIVDQKESMRKYNKRVIERLNSHGALGKKFVAAHCVHLNKKEIDTLKATEANVAHNPESNMNNAVGCTEILTMLKKGITVGLGTDGMSSDMLAQMRCGYLLQRHVKRDPRVGFVEAPMTLLDNNPKIIEKVTGWKLGKIEVGALADIILIDYIPPTILNEKNFVGHLLFGLVNAPVDTTICNGKIIMEGKRLVGLDESVIAKKTSELASRLWERLEAPDTILHG
jgi:putative selenium metabolism protein SsnA